MTIQFFGHPFSSYCQKAQIAFYENGIPFDVEIAEFVLAMPRTLH